MCVAAPGLNSVAVENIATQVRPREAPAVVQDKKIAHGDSEREEYRPVEWYELSVGAAIATSSPWGDDDRPLAGIRKTPKGRTVEMNVSCRSMSEVSAWVNGALSRKPAARASRLATPARRVERSDPLCVCTIGPIFSRASRTTPNVSIPTHKEDRQRGLRS